MEKGISGKIAGVFLQSKLSLLLVVAFLLLGLFSVISIPREEEPQIDVPMADMMLVYPGASPNEVERIISAPLEKVLSNIKGVENVFSTSMDGMAMVTVQFHVGEDVERSIVKLYNEVMKNMDQMPLGVTMPLIKTRSIDDVPSMSITLWGKDDGYALRQVAEEVADRLKRVPDVAQVKITGGRKREVRIEPDREKMSEAGLSIGSIAQALRGENVRSESGDLPVNGSVMKVYTGGFFSTVDELRNTIIGVSGDMPVYLHQVATITEGASLPSQYVSFGYGNALKSSRVSFPGDYPAVTLSIAKTKGSDAMQLAESVKEKVAQMQGNIITDDINVNITRDYGATASHKVSELLIHLLFAIFAVTLFVMLAMGWRGGLVVFLSVPITFALTLFSYYFLGYTLNRITLFALVFVTGIVTDDSIVIAENMYRHFKMGKLSPVKAALFAVNEVGNPTILATLTVIFAVLPMAFVSGMMGPYMSPMPIGASIAMAFSLFAALTLTPYFGFLFLRHKAKNEKIGNEEVAESSSEHTNEDLGNHNMFYRFYEMTMVPLLESRRKRWTFMIILVVVLLASLLLFPTKAVPVKILPSDNKSEFQIIVDMPEGTTLEQTNAVARELAAYAGQDNEVENYQIYSGTASPISFNGLVRHYDMRSGSNVADILVNLTPKSDRSEQSHDIARRMREPLQNIGKRYGANVKVVEIPPGPPVMSTIVAEIYGPDTNEQHRIADKMMNILSETDNVVDVDCSREDNHTQLSIRINKLKAATYGANTAMAVQEMRGAVAGMNVGVMHSATAQTQTEINIRYPEITRSSVADLLALAIPTQDGGSVRLRDIADTVTTAAPYSIFRKNQRRVVYVTAEVAGDPESPIYAMLDISERLKELRSTDGNAVEELYVGMPSDYGYSLKWDGEWKITHEVFRDLGMAFAFVLVLIYILIVGWSGNFVTPLVQLSVIPLSLIGIIIGHWVMGTYFSAPSMIGFIALAGIMVRNSILLIDFIDMRMRQGVPLKQAVIDSCAVRTMPILLTAGSVVLGAFIILFDPIFQGLAISLMGGTITSTILTLIVVPLLYYKQKKGNEKKKAE
ncbi:MAG: efflux RND transporter permease subunit [Prevotella sp.]|uniref:efflux RND transporter permease subunit n=1 Tax=Prevotella sp. TaxID=59823 RepID=UPI002A3332B5|nr:efflux RND transporter permease subunit [Prevotella sp.]MDD7318078.1 efflux RND transporter permease subunit [Prevotellaceae bacterium]MDY4021033.1 efflux RND transporter permease subunit [Prevotella sp.]